MNGKTKFIVIGVAVVLLGVGGLVASKLEAKQPGDPCETYDSGACSGEGAQCLVAGNSKYCSVSCTTDANCPSGWHCESVTEDTYSGQTGQRTETQQVKMCIRP